MLRFLLWFSCSTERKEILDSDTVNTTISDVDADMNGYLSSKDCNDNDTMS
ncbi:MAG: hypothetical protein VX278_07645 [Myxococcota bacterium]|nr:hypothetical protein [Myxococcota bacterium]